MKDTAFTEADRRYMKMAIDLSSDNIDNGGGPFGAVIVKDDEVISTGVNRVVSTHDPTAHAEVNAIRSACAALGTHELKGCTVYSSCEPCPMCMSALYWAGVERVVFGNTKEDAKAIHFDDSFIYDQLKLSQEDRTIICQNFMRAEANEAFRKWDTKTDKVPY